MTYAASLGSAAPTYDPGPYYDEALDPSGVPRPHSEPLLSELVGADLDRLRDAIAADLEAADVRFGSGDSAAPFRVDPVPRVLEAEEWERVERGLRQRTRALAAFTADVYGDRAIVAAGVVPRRLLDTAPYFEPWMLGVPVVAWAYAPVIGYDLVRGADGELRVLEDNLRTPSGLAYAVAAREAVDRHLPLAPPARRRSLEPAFEMLGDVLRAAAPRGGGDPSIALLSDGPSNSAWYEHVTLARRLGVPLVLPADLHQRGGRLYAWRGGRSEEVQVLYRRTDEDSLGDERHRPTWIGELALSPLRRGRLGVVNAPGGGVADDKLLHAYVDEMVRFYLGQEPAIESVPTYDLTEPGALSAAIARMGELVVKPRDGHGGHGVLIGPRASRVEREEMARRMREHPERFAAQEVVALSRHPTVCDGALAPRHVDLRAFALSAGASVRLVPGGLTRVALDAGSLVVNSSQNGGGKDTWVLA